MREQGIKINEAEELTLILKKRLFIPETTSCSHVKELDLTFLQLKNTLVTGVYSCAVSCENAIKLAALQCCTEDSNVDINEDFVDHKLNSLLPCKYAKIRGIASTIVEAYKSLDRKLRKNSNKAKSKYIQLCTTLEGYGITFFSGKVGIFDLL